MSLGKDNPIRPDYGLVSMRYVAEFGQLIMALVEDLPEICDDQQDNDGDSTKRHREFPQFGRL